MGATEVGATVVGGGGATEAAESLRKVINKNKFYVFSKNNFKNILSKSGGKFKDT